MAIVDIHPASIFRLPGKQKFRIKANSGRNTAARVNLMVKESIDCKNWFKVIALL